MKSKNRTFSIMAKVTLDTAIQVNATSLEEAIVKARELKTSDFIEILGDNNDSEVKITGVFE